MKSYVSSYQYLAFYGIVWIYVHFFRRITTHCQFVDDTEGWRHTITPPAKEVVIVPNENKIAVFNNFRALFFVCCILFLSMCAISHALSALFRHTPECVCVSAIKFMKHKFSTRWKTELFYATWCTLKVCLNTLTNTYICAGGPLSWLLAGGTDMTERPHTHTLVSPFSFHHMVHLR